MKDYDSIILWLDYYNKGLSRTKGRKIPKSLAIYDPLLSELLEAAVSLGYNITKDQINDSARFPRRPHIKSGYVMLSKNNMLKNKILKDIAGKMILNRSKQKNK
ncbi:MAG TPA: signal recognition particle subunit SRP19/SEC65 family protein [Candidatus Sulfopaludibacter sp.]|jgi:signal recognition particle subunit SRP19|nr:signal recognition particle subunit SRP19/SEC65 family protein [Candidatus Sulfopaludibacter sp.]